jgi:hypothetical protein
MANQKTTIKFDTEILKGQAQAVWSLADGIHKIKITSIREKPFKVGTPEEKQACNTTLGMAAVGSLLSVMTPELKGIHKDAEGNFCYDPTKEYHLEMKGGYPKDLRKTLAVKTA